MRSKVYQMTEGDMAIIQKMEETNNPNWFTSFYFRNRGSGTWWHPDQETDRWRLGYEALYSTWKKSKKPNSFQYGEEGKVAEYTVHWLNKHKPSFHHNHGFIFQPWQLKMYNTDTRITTVIGAYGAGKTSAGGIMLLTKAATKVGYRAGVVTPNALMAQAAFTSMLSLAAGTPYEERFILKKPESPHRKIIIGNSHVGENNEIMFVPIGDSIGVTKLLSQEVDEFFIDQSEQLSNFQDIIRVLGSRMRGMVAGRPREGHMIFSANPDLNDELWEIFDMAEKDPDRYTSLAPTTYDNPFITEEQLRDIEKDVGGDDESKRVYMLAGKPIGGGEHFSAESLKKCKSDELNSAMETGIKHKIPGFSLLRADRVGIHEWLLPPEHGKNYLVVADPGYGNPPKRDSPVILVFDYTDFPDVPAHLVGFKWVFGMRSPEPWLAAYQELVVRYGAFMSNAFDSTAGQAGYERLVPALNNIQAVGIQMNGNNKFVFLNHLKRFVARGMLKFPDIPAIFIQLSRYKMPDTNLNQDIVAALFVAAAWLEQTFFTSNLRYEPQEEEPVTESRYSRNGIYERGPRWGRRQGIR
jgi:hypothetical protein